MKRLRHPIRAITEPFGKAGLIVAMIALLAALGGTALAAAKLNSTQKKEVEKIAKKVSKPGPAGPAGPAGAPGAKGDAGAAGSNGINGTNGVSAEALHINGPAHCSQGGVEVKSAAAPAYVCNGQTGFTSTLPSGKTETGAWALTEVAKTTSPGRAKIPISFNIPLPEAQNETAVKVIGQGETGTAGQGCGGGSAQSPTAEPGFLCVYITFSSGDAENHPIATSRFFAGNPETGEETAGTTGTVLQVFPATEGNYAFGDWAVTAK